MSIYKESFADYKKRSDRFNASTAKKRFAGESWEAIKYAIDNPKESSPAMLKGTIVHALTFEQETFDDEFAVAPAVDKRTKAGKETWQKFEEENSGKIIISSQVFSEAMSIVEALLSNKKAARIIEGCEEREVSGLWDDFVTGVKCRARFDGLNNRIEAAVDLKTTNDITDRGIMRAMDKYFYYEQAAHYMSGLSNLDRPHEKMIFIFVSTMPPFESRCVVVFFSELTQSLRALEKTMLEYYNCVINDTWPGYSSELLHLKRKDFSALS